MPVDPSRPGARLARRRFLGALALAPAALAGCASAAASGPPAPAGSSAAGAAAAGPPPRGPAPDAAIGAVREQPLSPDAEPAFVFRAGAARPGEP